MDRQGYQRAPAPTGGNETPVTGADHGQFHDRLDAIAARLDRLAQRTRAPAPGAADHARQQPQFGDGIDPLDQPLSPLIADSEALDPRREPPRAASVSAATFSL